MQNNRKGFTLIELLVVIAIIAILAAILFPVFAQAKDAAKKTTEISNMKQMALASQMYLADHDDRFFMSNSGGNPMGWGFGPPDTVPGMALAPYVKNTQVHICLKDPYSEGRRISEHASDLGWDANALTDQQRMYALMARSNVGLNYAFFSPWRYLWEEGNPTSATISAGDVGDVSGTILFATSIWYRDSGGNPTGGGNWVIETPCWQDADGEYLRPLSAYASGSGDGTLWSYPSGWANPTPTIDGNSWLVYGGTWPFWNQSSLGHIQPGLKDGQVVTAMADGSVKSRPVKRLTEGCIAYGTGQYKGTVTDSTKFLWDLD